MIRYLAASLLSMLLTLSAFAQDDEKDIYFQIGEDDAALYIENYMRPFFNGLGYAFTGGWYNTAETHKRFGFDITLTTSVAFVPRKDLTFTFDNASFEKIKVVDGSTAQLPTLFGPQDKEERPEIAVYDDNGEQLVRLSAPPGALNMKEQIGFNAVPFPMIQAGIGVGYGTDVRLRFVPKLNFDGTSVSMFGLGIQHDLAQWIRRLAIEDVSVAFLGAFNGLTTKADLSYDDPETNGNQGIFKINGLNLQAIASKEYIDLITIFGGVGYSRAGSRTQILGTYPIDDDYAELSEDPIDLRYGNSGMNLSAGITIKLVAVTVSLSHTFQKYQVTSLGVGVSVR